MKPSFLTHGEVDDHTKIDLWSVLEAVLSASQGFVRRYCLMTLKKNIPTRVPNPSPINKSMPIYLINSS